MEEKSPSNGRDLIANGNASFKQACEIPKKDNRNIAEIVITEWLIEDEKRRGDKIDERLVFLQTSQGPGDSFQTPLHKLFL